MGLCRQHEAPLTVTVAPSIEPCRHLSLHTTMREQLVQRAQIHELIYRSSYSRFPPGKGVRIGPHELKHSAPCVRHDLTNSSDDLALVAIPLPESPLLSG